MKMLAVLVLMSLGCAGTTKLVPHVTVVEAAPTHIEVDVATPTHVPQVSLDLATAVATVCIDLSDDTTVELTQRIIQRCVNRSLDSNDKFFQTNCMNFACNVLRRAAAKSDCSDAQNMNLWK